MTIIQLEYLLAVANCGSFSLAAEHCFVTQPSLSMQVKALEEELGVVLLDRSKKPVIPTEAGEVVLEQARETIKAYNYIKEAVSELKGETAGKLRLGVIPTIAPYLLHKFLPGFVHDYPHVELEVKELMTRDIVDAMKHDRIDAALVAGGTCGDGHSTECHTYGFENLAEAFKLTAGFLRSLAALLDGFLVLVQLTVHIVEGGFGIVELNLPVLGAAVVLSKGGGGILQSLAKGVDFCGLLVDLFSQHLVPCGESLHGFVIFIELRGGELHFGAEHLEGLVDIRQCFFELFFTLKTDLQSETVCHVPSPP